MIYTINSVKDCRNLMISESKGYPTAEYINELNEYNEINDNILDTCMYQRIPNSNLKTTGRGVDKITIYYSDESAPEFFNMKMLDGRFLWNKDIDRDLNYIVLDKETAIGLFATVKCAGQSVKLSNKDYQVLGVYETKKSLINELSAVDYRACFVPLAFDGASSGSFNVMFRVKEGSSVIMENNIEKFITDTFRTDVSLENIDLKYRLTEQKVVLVSSFILIVLLIGLYNKIKPVILKYYIGIKQEYSECYPLELMKRYKYKLAFLIILLCFISYVFIYVIGKINIEFVIDPSIIPSRLINIDELYQKLKAFAIENNTKPVISNVLSKSIEYASKCINYSALIFAWCLTTLLAKWSQVNRTAIKKEA